MKKLKLLQITAIFIAVIALYVSCPNGSTTEVITDPVEGIRITTVDEFIQFAEAVNGGEDFAGQLVVLDSDIDLDGRDFNGIGIDGMPFRGKFDGNKKTISNVSITETDTSPVGVFGLVQNATIKNFTVKNGTITGRRDVGGAVGKAENSNISGIRTGAGLSITADSVETPHYIGYTTYVGGIIGRTSRTRISNVYNEASVTGRAFVGGVVGRIEGRGADGPGSGGDATLQYAYNTGTVTGTEHIEPVLASEIGGIVGYILGDGNSISHVYNSGTLKGTGTLSADIGGIVGGVVKDTSLGGEDQDVNLSNVFNSNSNKTDFLTNGRHYGQIIGRIGGRIDPRNDIIGSLKGDGSKVTWGPRIYRENGNATKAIGVISTYFDGDLLYPEAHKAESDPPAGINSFDSAFTAENFHETVFENDPKWVTTNGGSFPTLAYFEGWDTE